MRGGKSFGGRRERDPSPFRRRRRRSPNPPMPDRHPRSISPPPRDRRRSPSPPRQREPRDYHHGSSPPRQRDPRDYHHHGLSTLRERDPREYYHHGSSAPRERDRREDYRHRPCSPSERDSRDYNYSLRQCGADLQDDRDGLGHLHKPSRPIIGNHGFPISSGLPDYDDNIASNRRYNGLASSLLPGSAPVVRAIYPSDAPALNSGMTNLKYGWTEILKAQEEGLGNPYDSPNKEFAMSTFYGASSSGAIAKGAPYGDHHNRTMHLPAREERPPDCEYDGLKQRSRDVRMDCFSGVPFGGGNLRKHFEDGGRDVVRVADASPKNMDRNNFWKEEYELSRDHYVIKGIQKNYEGVYESVRRGNETRLSGHPDRTHFREDNEFRRDLYKEQPDYADNSIDVFRRSMSLPRTKAPREDIRHYDRSPQSLVKRRYSLDRDFDHNDSLLEDGWRSIPDSRNRIDTAEQYRDKAVLSPSPNLSYGSGKKRGPFARLSGGDVGLRPHDASARARGGHGLSLNKQLKPAVHRGSHVSFKRKPGVTLQKSLNKDLQDKRAGRRINESDVPEDGMHLVKKDPPEDSEEFKKQVNKAFLQFVKVLFGSPLQQKKYRKPEKDSSLDCCVCGSLLKKHFADTHDLVAHTFNCQRAGLRTEHLGLHKAICMLMGWNWLIAPDVSRRYQSGTPELNSLKDDLILWPPIVVIHNRSDGAKTNTGGPKIITNKGMENILAGMAFERSKFDVCRGKPADKSILLVKFKGTLSGLQEAERLHKRYTDNNHGRKEFAQIVSAKNSNADTEKVEELSYGYIATVEDLEKLDTGTKKMCVVRSKKDIEAIADAPLDTD